MEGLRLVSRQFRKQRLAVWAAGRGLRSALHCHGVLALRDRPLSGALLAVQEGGRMEGLRLVSRQFRKQRLAVWAAGRGPDPYFTAMVFWLCETVLLTWSFAGSAGRRANGRSATSFFQKALAVWAAGRGPEEDRQTDSQTDRSTDKQTDRQTDSMGCWPRARSALHCHGDMVFCSARLAFERSFAGSAGRRANGRSETSF